MRGETVKKNYKHRFFFIILFLTVVVLTTNYALAQKKIIYSHDMNPDTQKSTHAFALVFKNYVESRTNGEYLVEIYPNNILGGQRECIELVKENTIQVHQGSIGGISQIYKPAILINTPFMYSSTRIARAVYDSEFTKDLFEEMREKTGIRSIFINERGGFSAFTNSVRPIHKPEDMKGIKFRAMDESQIKLYKSLGANAIPMAWQEVYIGLQTGVVEGQMNPLPVIADAHLYEVQKYLSLVNVVPGTGWVIVNDQWYTNLPSNVKNIVDDAFYYANKVSSGLTLLNEAVYLEKLKEEGMEINSLTKANLIKFRNLARDEVLDWAKTQMDPQIVNEFIQTVKEIEDSLSN